MEQLLSKFGEWFFRLAFMIFLILRGFLCIVNCIQSVSSYYFGNETFIVVLRDHWFSTSYWIIFFQIILVHYGSGIHIGFFFYYSDIKKKKFKQWKIYLYCGRSAIKFYFQCTRSIEYSSSVALFSTSVWRKYINNINGY